MKKVAIDPNPEYQKMNLEFNFQRSRKQRRRKERRKKKKERKQEKRNPSARRPDETENDWAKRQRDEKEAEDKKHADVRSALSELNAFKQKGEGNEEEKHEPVNKFTKDSRGRKAIEIADDEKQKYLEKDDGRELVRQERDYKDGLFSTSVMD